MQADLRTRIAITAVVLASSAVLAGNALAISSRTLIAPTGAAAGDRFGSSVSSAGDVNGDGYADVIVGAPFNDAGGADAGRAYVYYGGPGADGVADLTLEGEGDVEGGGRGYVRDWAAGVSAGTVATLAGAAASDTFGTSVSSAGDVNGDGYADVLVAAPFNDTGGAEAGRAYVYYGGPGADAVADLI